MARLEICRNFLVQGKCDGWIRARFKNDEFVGGWDELGASDLETAEEICSACRHFEMEKRLLFSEQP